VYQQREQVDQYPMPANDGHCMVAVPMSPVAQSPPAILSPSIPSPVLSSPVLSHQPLQHVVYVTVPTSPQQQIFEPKQGYPIQVTQQNMPPRQTTYRTATPLTALGRYAAPVDCPSCGERAVTRIEYVTGNATHAWACGLFWVTGFFCMLPYCHNGFKDVEHRCGNCGMMLALCHRSGGTEVHQFG